MEGEAQAQAQAQAQAKDLARRLTPEDVDRLPDDPALLKALLKEVLVLKAELEQVAQLKEQVRELQRMVFGRRSERLTPARPRATSQGQPRPGHGRRPLPKNLPRIRRTYTLPENERMCGRCGDPLKKIGEETLEQLDWIPALLRVIRHIREKWACSNPTCQQTVLTAERPALAIEKGLPAEGLLAHVITSKYADHLPLYRQEGILQRHGVQIPRSTLCGWIEQAAQVLEPLVQAMEQDVLKGKVVQTDDIPVPVLDPGSGKTKEGRLWGYLGDAGHRHVTFRYSPDRKGEHPQEVLQDYCGYLQADAYAGYDAVFKAGKAVEVACWAHGRRYVFKAHDTDSERSKDLLERIGQLYEVEEEAKRQEMTAEQVKQLRAEKSKPRLDEIEGWLKEKEPQVLPKSPMGKAIGYLKGQWGALNRYLEDGNLEIDNNSMERTLRGIAVGRGNWMFAGSDEGGRRAAVIYSLIESCKLHKIDPFAYLRDVLERIATHPAKDILDLSPARWKPRPRQDSS